jgi:hypothetical protein
MASYYLLEDGSKLLLEDGSGLLLEVPTWTGSGTPSLPILTASGAGKLTHKGSGTPSLPKITATGAGKKARKGTGTPSLPILTATGAGSSAEDVFTGSGAVSLPKLAAAGSGSAAEDIYSGTGTPRLPVLTATGAGELVAVARVSTDQPSGGYGFGAYDPTLYRRRKEREELEALAQEIAALEQHIAEERNVAPEVVRIEATVRAMPNLPKPARRAVNRALRIQTYGALAHAETVLRRLEEEEEEFAILFAMALH